MLTRAQFIFVMAVEICAAFKCAPVKARELAATAYREFLADSNIAFGACDYAWDQAAARTVAREYVIGL